MSGHDDLSAEECGAIGALLLVAKEAMERVAKMLPAPIAGTPKDEARRCVGCATTFIEMTGHWVRRMEIKP